MPPAFNLSQDQTLQFNLCWLAFLPYPFRDRSLKILTRSVLANFPIFTSCEHFNVLSIQISSKASLHRTSSSAHTYRLLVVKEPGLARSIRRTLRCLNYFVAAVKSFCLSAAEKRDYEASFFLRQLLFAEFFACCVSLYYLLNALYKNLHAVINMLHNTTIPAFTTYFFPCFPRLSRCVFCCVIKREANYSKPS